MQVLVGRQLMGTLVDLGTGIGRRGRRRDVGDRRDVIPVEAVPEAEQQARDEQPETGPGDDRRGGVELDHQDAIATIRDSMPLQVAGRQPTLATAPSDRGHGNPADAPHRAGRQRGGDSDVGVGCVR